MQSRVPNVFDAFRNGGASFDQKLHTLRAFLRVASAAEMAQFVGEMRAMAHARAARAQSAARKVVAESGIAPRANAAMDRAMGIAYCGPAVTRDGNVTRYHTPRTPRA